MSDMIDKVAQVVAAEIAEHTCGEWEPSIAQAHAIAERAIAALPAVSAPNVAELVEALRFYRNGFERKSKRTKTGLLLSVEYVPTEALLDDCGNRATDALARIGGQ